jgi:hypothetical protein
MSSTFIALTILALVLFVALVQAKLEQSRLKQRLRRYEALDDKERYQRQLESNIHLLENKQESLNTQIINRQQQLRELDAKASLQSLDYYEPKYKFTSSDTYTLIWKSTNLEQEQMRKNKGAFISHKQFKLNDSDKAGEKMTQDILALIEYSLENQFKFVMKEVKHNNFDDLKRKLETAFKKINSLSTRTQCEISQEYLNLKVRELNIKYDLEKEEQKAREMQQEIKKQNKQVETIENARQKAKNAEQREIIHQQELEEVRGQIEQAEGEKRKQLELQIQQLEEKLAEDRRDKENANRGKWGYIYIISNIGSFREKDVYRICMTNRQREDEFIRELNPAVPFRFDVHFKIFSEDALDTLERLHQRFDDKRVNLKNPRREFFQVSIDEIEQAVQEIKKKTGFLRIETFEPAPQAYEYHQTLAARKKHQQATTNDTDLEVD